MAGMVNVTASALHVVPAAGAAADARVSAVVTEHYDFVWRSLRRLGVPETTADDEAQQVFCVFARRAGEVPEGKEKTFLFGVVIRVAQASRRVASRRAEVSDDEAIARVVASSPGPDDQLDDARARAVLDELLGAMPTDLRTVFLLYELEEMTMADIAATLAIPPGTVASRLRRARETFQGLARRAQDAMNAKGDGR
jgi:RNA polymerase sigma-70 factor, ECF subfamily